MFTEYDIKLQQAVVTVITDNEYPQNVKFLNIWIVFMIEIMLLDAQ